MDQPTKIDRNFSILKEGRIMNYKYILANASVTDMIRNYRLVSHCQLNEFHIAIRVEIPEDIKLKHWRDDYFTTDAYIPICDLRPVIVCKTKDSWEVNSELTGMFRHDGVTLDDLRLTLFKPIH